MNKYQKAFAPIIVIGIIILVLVSAGEFAYYLINKNKLARIVVNNQNQQSQNSNEPQKNIGEQGNTINGYPGKWIQGGWNIDNDNKVVHGRGIDGINLIYLKGSEFYFISYDGINSNMYFGIDNYPGRIVLNVSDYSIYILCNSTNCDSSKDFQRIENFKAHIKFTKENNQIKISSIEGWDFSYVKNYQGIKDECDSANFVFKNKKTEEKIVIFTPKDYGLDCLSSNIFALSKNKKEVYFLRGYEYFYNIYGFNLETRKLLDVGFTDKDGIFSPDNNKAISFNNDGNQIDFICLDNKDKKMSFKTLKDGETLLHSFPEGINSILNSVEINWIDNNVEYEIYKKGVDGTYTFIRKEKTEVICQ